MNADLVNKLNELPWLDRKKFAEYKENMLNDRDFAVRYGMSEEDYNTLNPEKVSEAEEKIYNELFGKKNPIRN
ncbi:MAG TPA: hypothetical protein PK357_02440 [Candidatus Pacearchaeota archaeon]|nr:hypothetical protein [Candidatus Pacearchaeota archaeon]